ncbi:MAG: hypothetical protein DRR06_00430 [Gammaproteobacteria bacterium]|nr:MAG: hypothetical protein DRR06_00430 [Gammaproteobacteria bacterium]RLA54646.1 MAG: hypothetical protein DRR42_01095 [Gammaproteobacteria bacterium]
MQMSGLQLKLKCRKIAGAVVAEVEQVAARTGIMAGELVANGASILQLYARFTGVAGGGPGAINAVRSELVKAIFIGRVG